MRFVAAASDTDGRRRRGRRVGRVTAFGRPGRPLHGHAPFAELVPERVLFGAAAARAGFDPIEFGVRWRRGAGRSCAARYRSLGTGSSRVGLVHAHGNGESGDGGERCYGVDRGGDGDQVGEQAGEEGADSEAAVAPQPVDTN